MSRGSRKWRISDWRSLLRDAIGLIDTLSENPEWTFGGGTSLAIRYHHRTSYDIDIFVRSAQVLTDLSPNKNPATKALPETWSRWDEWYNFKYLNPDLHILLKIDEKSYTGGENGDNHPMVWYHEYEGGRSFYTELGHTDESFSDSLYLGHLLGGIQYAIGKK